MVPIIVRWKGVGRENAVVVPFVLGEARFSGFVGGHFFPIQGLPTEQD
ncbi:MAG: hypothetical protein ACI8VE_000742, partial [Natrialbaceae archaeon]